MQRGIREMEKYGWQVVSTEAVDQGYSFSKTCCLAVIFLPLALLGRKPVRHKVQFVYVGVPGSDKLTPALPPPQRLSRLVGAGISSLLFIGLCLGCIMVGAFINTYDLNLPTTTAVKITNPSSAHTTTPSIIDKAILPVSTTPIPNFIQKNTTTTMPTKTAIPTQTRWPTATEKPTK